MIKSDYERRVVIVANCMGITRRYIFHNLWYRISRGSARFTMPWLSPELHRRCSATADRSLSSSILKLTILCLHEERFVERFYHSHFRGDIVLDISISCTSFMVIRTFPMFWHMFPQVGAGLAYTYLGYQGYYTSMSFLSSAFNNLIIPIGCQLQIRRGHLPRKPCARGLFRLLYENENFAQICG